MVLVDTSVWIDHLNQADQELAELLDRASVVQHPMVIGELSLGTLRDRGQVLGLLGKLPPISVATHTEVAEFVEGHALHGRGLSLVDAHLLASTILTPGTRLWTRDKRLHEAAGRLGIDHS